MPRYTMEDPHGMYKSQPTSLGTNDISGVSLTDRLFNFLDRSQCDEPSTPPYPTMQKFYACRNLRYVKL